MNVIVIHTIAEGIIFIILGSRNSFVQIPGRLVISLDGRLHQQCTTQHVGHVAIQTLHIFIGIRQAHTILVRMRVNQTSTELDELGLHRIVYTGRETLVVGASTFQSTLLVEIVQTYIISIIGTTATQIDVVVLAYTGLKHLLKPIGIGTVHKLIAARLRIQAIATGQWCVRIGSSLPQIVTILISIHHVVSAAGDNVDTKVALIVDLHRLVLLTVLGSDDNHTICSTRTVDGACRSVLQHLDGLDVVRREVANGRTHGHTVDDIQRSGASERTQTTNLHRGISTRLTVRRNLYTCHLTFKHRRDVRIRHTLQFLGVHNRHRTRQISFLLRTVTHDNHLIQHVVVRLQLDLINDGAPADSDFPVLVAHITYHECSIRCRINLEVTVHIGHTSRLSTFHPDSSTNQGFPGLVYHLTLNLDGLLGHSCLDIDRTDGKSTRNA